MTTRINSPTDMTVVQLREDVARMRERINALSQEIGQRSPDFQRVLPGECISTTTGDENIQRGKLKGIIFDPGGTEQRSAGTDADSWVPDQQIFNSGHHFPENLPLWCANADNGWYALAMRWGGQLWFGTTTSIVAVGGTGTVDMITDSGTMSVTAHDFFGEEIGSGVLVVLSLIHISEPTRLDARSRMPSSA